MKAGTLYFGMATVFILLVIGIALYTFGGFPVLLGDLDLIVIAGLVVLYILLGKDPSLQPKRAGIEAPGATRQRLDSPLCVAPGEYAALGHRRARI